MTWTCAGTTRVRRGGWLPNMVANDERPINGNYALYYLLSMEESAVPELSTGKDNAAACTIQPDGYARWYKVGDKAAGKTLSVQVPKDAGFWAYDAAGNVVGSSLLWKDTPVELPEDGLIVFAGNPGAKFQLTFQ